MKKLASVVVLALLFTPALGCEDPTVPTEMHRPPLACYSACGPDETGGGGTTSPRALEETLPEVLMMVPRP